MFCETCFSACLTPSSLTLLLSSSPCPLTPPLAPEQVVPILRAGLVLLEQAATMLPVTQTYHVGYVRNEDTLEVCVCRRGGP